MIQTKYFRITFDIFFARTFYKGTNNLVNLAGILGHSSLEITRVYTTEKIQVWIKNIETLDLVSEWSTT